MLPSANLDGVGWLVGQQDYTKTIKWILTMDGGWV